MVEFHNHLYTSLLINGIVLCVTQAQKRKAELKEKKSQSDKTASAKS